MGTNNAFHSKPSPLTPGKKNCVRTQRDTVVAHPRRSHHNQLQPTLRPLGFPREVLEGQESVWDKITRPTNDGNGRPEREPTIPSKYGNNK